MAWFDVDGFLASLPPRGVAAAHLPLYREAAHAILDGAPDGRLTATMIDDALARAAMAGGSERRLANLRRVGEAMLEYVGAGARTIGGPGVVASVAAIAPAAAAAIVSAHPPVALELAVDLPRRAAPPPPRESVARGEAPVRLAGPMFDPPPRPGCVCRKREEAYLDDYWQDVGTTFLGITGLAGGVAWRFAPPYTWLTVTTAILTLGALLTGLTVGWRCEACRRWLAWRGLDGDERGEVRRRGLVFIGIAVALGVVCALAFREARAWWHHDEVTVPTLRDD